MFNIFSRGMRVGASLCWPATRLWLLSDAALPLGLLGSRKGKSQGEVARGSRGSRGSFKVVSVYLRLGWVIWPAILWIATCSNCCYTSTLFHVDGDQEDVLFPQGESTEALAGDAMSLLSGEPVVKHQQLPLGMCQQEIWGPQIGSSYYNNCEFMRIWWDLLMGFYWTLMRLNQQKSWFHLDGWMTSHRDVTRVPVFEKMGNPPHMAQAEEISVLGYTTWPISLWIVGGSLLVKYRSGSSPAGEMLWGELFTFKRRQLELGQPKL